MYNTKLKQGDIISIYTDYKNNLEFEGTALLIEKLEDGDTFFREDESINSNPGMNLTPHPTKEKYNTLLNEVFKQEPMPREVRKLKKDLLTIKSNKLGEYNEMYSYLKRERDILCKSDIIKGQTVKESKLKKMFSEISLDYIVRYFQQFNANINNPPELKPSIFKYEKWKVLLLYDNNGYEINRTVTRKIRVLVKNKCGPKHLSNYITYNSKKGTPTNDRKKVI